jgi:DNA-binding transcriptional ArsR family regulator
MEHAKAVSREADVAEVAAAIGDPSRARMLLALAGGGALPASALAAETGVARSTVSGHLNRLRAARLVTVEHDGRHRYYRLATPDVARALEHLALIARPLPPRTLGEDGRARALLRARLCYDHVAGRLGVALMSALCEREILAAEGTGETLAYVLTAHGREELGAFGVDLAGLPRRRASVRYCVDWAEQRHHLAGGLGTLLTDRLFALGWLRRGRYRRVVHLTDHGRAGLTDVFGVPADAGI